MAETAPRGAEAQGVFPAQSHPGPPLASEQSQIWAEPAKTGAGPSPAVNGLSRCRRGAEQSRVRRGSASGAGWPGEGSGANWSCLTQLYLRELLRLMHPRFYQHLVSLGEDGLQVLFCHRWLLLCFKREFPEAEALRIWEACWARCQVGPSPSDSHHPAAAFQEGRVPA